MKTIYILTPKLGDKILFNITETVEIIYCLVPLFAFEYSDGIVFKGHLQNKKKRKILLKKNFKAQ